jgi:hypothetical protein
MARRSARRSYVRDGRGRFASTGTTTTKAKPAARRAQRGTNRITRDNSGKITGVGKNGATARGGRLRTAAGNQRGAVLDRMKRAPMAGTMRGRVQRDPGAMGKVGPGAKPVAAASRKSKRPKTTNQRAAALMKAHKKAIIQYEVKNAIIKAAKRTTPAERTKLTRQITATVNRLKPETQIKLAQTYVQRNRAEKMKNRPRINFAARQANQESAKRRQSFLRASAKAERFTQNASSIYADKSTPLNARKLANAVIKGVRKPVPRGRGKMQFIKTEKADPSKYERQAAVRRSAVLSSRRIAKGRENSRRAAEATKGMKQGRPYVAAGNKMRSRMGVKQRLPKRRLARLPKVQGVMRGDPSPKGLTAYQRMLREQGKPSSKAFAKLQQSQQPAKPVRRTERRRPSGASPLAREASRLRAAAASVDRKALPTPSRDGNGLAINISNKMRKDAARLSEIDKAQKAQAWASRQEAKRRAKPVVATGTRKDGNRLRTLNNRLRYYAKNGLTPDELKVQATRAARNALVTTMRGQRATVRTRQAAKAAQRSRRDSILSRTRGTIGRRGRNGRGNPRIRAVDTGMRQLALVGRPKKLKRYKPVK